MKRAKFWMFAGLLCSLCQVNAWGDEPPSAATLRNSGLTYDYYRQNVTQPSPSDAPVVPIDACGSDTSCACEDFDDCGVCEPWRLFPEFGSGWTLQGWLAAGATANSSNLTSNYNGPMTFNDRAEAQFNQAYVSFGRNADTGGCGFDWGARLDALAGSDYIFTMAAGLETNPDGTNNLNGHHQFGLAIPQAYVELAFNNLSIKLGHFYTIMGYEVVPANGNFFLSHAYTMQYGEPFTHTGALAAWKLGDEWTLYGGLLNGWDKLDAQHDMMAGQFGFGYAPCHGRYTLMATIISGEEDGVAAATLGPRTMYSVVFTYNISDAFQYVFQHDCGWQDGVPVGPGFARNEWYGINQYLFYTINECWKAGARVEWFRDDDGFRLGGTFPIRSVHYGGPAFMTPAGAAGNYFEFATGVNWTPSANIRVRPELRWDWSDGTLGQPYAEGTRDSQFTAAFDVILLF